MSGNARIGLLLVTIAGLSWLATGFGQEIVEARIDDLKLTVPASWKQQKPSNRLRLGQFEIPAVAGDKESAELTIFNFGAGGGVNANLKRWVDQFQPAGRHVESTMGKCRLGDYVLVDVKGTYNKPVGPPQSGKTEPMPSAEMLGVILSVEKKGLYFLKLTGPEKTVSAAATALRASIGGKKQDEKPYDPQQEKPS